MMTNDDRFAATLAAAILRAGDQEVQAEVLDDIRERDDGLDAALREMREFPKRSGDFGMEILGPVMMAALIAAAKGLWSVYVDRLTSKLGESLADFTFEQIKALTIRIWTGQDQTVSIDEFERLLRLAAEQEQLPTEQVDALVAAARSPRVRDELAGT